MDLALTCLSAKEFGKLKEIIAKHTSFYEKREDQWIKSILGRLDSGTIKGCKQDDLKRIIYIIDMWNYSDIGDIDSEIEKICRKLKKFYFETHSENELA